MKVHTEGHICKREVHKLKRELTNEEIEELKEYGYSDDEIKKGFDIFQSEFMGGALHIERLDDINMYDGDSEAADIAETQFGIKLLHDIPFDELPDYEFGFYIDEEENVELIKKYLRERYGIDWRTED